MRAGATRQHFKAPRGCFRAAIQSGAPVRALRTLAYVGTIAGNRGEDGASARTATVAQRIGRSSRAVQRDLADLDQVVEGFKVTRKRDPRNAKRCYPNHYQAPSCAREEEGTLVWTDYLRRPEWLGAPSSAQGIFLVLLEVLGPKGAQRSARELAEACGVGATCVRDAIRYWRGVGWLEAEERRRADGGRAPNWLRPRPPWELEELEAGEVTPEELRGRRRQAHVTRYAGLLVAKLDSERIDGSPALFDRLAIGLERGDVAEVLGELLGELVALRDAGLYAGSCKRKHVRQALEDLVDRRPAFEAEIAELRANGGIGRLFGAQPEGEREAHGAEDVEGTFRLAELEDLVGAADWEIWIRPLRVFRGPGGLVRLVAPNRYYVEWIGDHYAEALDELFAPPEVAQELARARAEHADQVAGAERELEELEGRLRSLSPGGERAEVRRLAQSARWKLEEARRARPSPSPGRRAWELVSDEQA